MENTLEKIFAKYQVDKNMACPAYLNISRWKEWPLLLKELGVKTAVEIGVYKGQFSECLKTSIPDLDLIGVDAWKVYKGYKDYGVTDLETEAYNCARVRAEKHGFRLMQAWSVDAAREFADESLDFVFIDGNHDFQHVVEDLAAWAPKVKKGGIVAGHDFFENKHGRYGVQDAVPAWCRTNSIPYFFVVKHDHCPSWFYVKQ